MKSSIVLKKSLQAFLISVIQLIVIIVVHDITYWLFPINHPTANFGITIFYSMLFFSILLFVYNISIRLRQKSNYLLGLTFFILNCIYPSMVYDYRPWRVLFLISLTLLGFISSVLIYEFRK